MLSNKRPLEPDTAVTPMIKIQVIELSPEEANALLSAFGGYMMSIPMGFETTDAPWSEDEMELVAAMIEGFDSDELDSEDEWQWDAVPSDVEQVRLLDAVSSDEEKDEENDLGVQPMECDETPKLAEIDDKSLWELDPPADEDEVKAEEAKPVAANDAPASPSLRGLFSPATAKASNPNLAMIVAPEPLKFQEMTVAPAEVNPEVAPTSPRR
jgi:hypothetical protein